MLTDKKIKSLKPQEKLYKVADRDGLYLAVNTGGTLSFRFDYRFNGRRETIYFGKYGPDGVSLAEAREKLIEAKKLINVGISPAANKRDGVEGKKSGTVFQDYVIKYIQETRFANSTRAMKEAIARKEIYPVIGKCYLEEITTQRVRAICEKIKERGAPATALQVREIIGSVFTMSLTVAMKLKTPSTALKHRQLPSLKRVSVHHLLKKLASYSTNLKITVAIQR